MVRNPLEQHYRLVARKLQGNVALLVRHGPDLSQAHARPTIGMSERFVGDCRLRLSGRKVALAHRQFRVYRSAPIAEVLTCLMTGRPRAQRV